MASEANGRTITVFEPAGGLYAIELDSIARVEMVYASDGSVTKTAI